MLSTMHQQAREAFTIAFCIFVLNACRAVVQEGCGALVVDRSIDLARGETCGSHEKAVRLEDTDWKLVRFGVRVVQHDTESEIYLRLRSDGHRMRGFGGCQGVFGRYELNDQSLRFVAIGTTDWTCSTTTEQQEVFVRILRFSARWNIWGECLDLYDARHALLARFESTSRR